MTIFGALFDNAKEREYGKRIDNLVEVAATRAQRSAKNGNYTMQKMGLFYRVFDRVVVWWGWWRCCE